LTEIFAALGELMPNQREAIFDGGFYQTVIELLACSILIWEDVKHS